MSDDDAVPYDGWWSDDTDDTAGGPTTPTTPSDDTDDTEDEDSPPTPRWGAETGFLFEFPNQTSNALI